MHEKAVPLVILVILDVHLVDGVMKNTKQGKEPSKNMRMIKKSAKKRTRLKWPFALTHNYARGIKSKLLNVKCVGMCVSHIKNMHIARGGSEKCASGIFENDHM